MAKNCIGVKEKCRNKGNDKYENADSLTQYNKSYFMFVPKDCAFSRFLGPL